MDADRIEGMQRAVEAVIGSESKQLIMQLLGQIDNLSGAEKLLLYLKLPTGPPPVDPLKQPINPLGSRSEIQQTVMWIQTHLEVDPEISLPKQDVYEEYMEYCTSTKMKPLSTADFGKVMKQVYPCVKPRRLGTRGNSRYCYAGMRKRVKLEVPQLPDLEEKPKTIEIPTAQNELVVASSHLVREWAEKRLGLKFGNLCALAQHLIDKNFVDRSSPAAHVILNTNTESFESASMKNLNFGNKVQPRGVIKQLKRKIQGQPQSSAKMSSMKKMKSQVETLEDNKNMPDGNHTPDNCHLKQDFQLKIEAEQAISDYPFQSPHLLVRKQEYVNTPESSTNVSSASVDTLNASFPTEYSQNVAVNLSQSSIVKTRFSPPQTTGGIKTSAMTIRQPIYNDPYKFDHFSDSKPTSLRFNNVAACSEIVRSPNTINSNLPINLSNNADCKNPLKIFKSFPVYKDVESQSPRCDSNSLNLSVPRRDNWFPPQEITNAINPVKIPPLPGKKMFLETYNANQMVSTSSLPNEQNVKSTPYSPINVDRVQYLPKKMRATESFGGKLASSRLNENVSLDAQQNEPEKYKLATEDFNQSSSQEIQNNVPNSNMNFEMNSDTDPVSSAKVAASNFEFSNLISPEASVNQMDESQNIQKCSYSYKKGQKSYKGNKKVMKSKSPDSTSSFNKNDIYLQNAPMKMVTRGRPRKKSLTKAKYTRRQPRAKIDNNIHNCENVKHKRSSDSISSLTESINIKSGIICAENHSEIMNRERVSSICNMDKHALDDYLNEGSQEHEEELLKYFQQNCDNLSTDNVDKDNLENIIESDVKTDIPNSSVADSKQNTSVLTPGVITSMPNTNLDINEDHSQGNNEKISQLREILQKNLKHNTSNVPSGNVENATGFIINADNSESAFTTITRRKAEVSQGSFDFHESPNIPNQSTFSKKPSEQYSHVQDSALPKRRVSFENQIINQENSRHDNSPSYNKGQNSVPQSPTSRVQHFNFMPISPGRISPVSNKNSPLVTSYKSVTSPAKVCSTTSTSPISMSSSASPFVSPRNTPLLRMRNACTDKPSFNKSKKLPRLGIPKNTYFGEKVLAQKDPHINQIGNFIIPNEHSTVPRSPNYTTKTRAFPMSAPPSPNILTSKYKPCFTPQPQISSPRVLSNTSQDTQTVSCFTNPESSPMHVDSQPHSADPLSREISQFFTGNSLSLDDTNNSLRSQSVPLHQNNSILENRQLYFNNTQCDSTMSNIILTSYNNTPCNSVPQTPVPNEFCDFGSLNDTCESITKVVSNDLGKIYDALSSETRENLINDVVKQDGMLLNTVEPDSSEIPNFPRNMASIYPNYQENSSKIVFDNRLQQNYTERGVANEVMKRSNSVEVSMNDADNRFYISRSVPSTPLPGAKLGLLNFDLTKTSLNTQNQSYMNEFTADQKCNKNIISKSVPSTPLLTDDRNVFSYSNRDFLINGNSVDQSISSGFVDKKMQNENQLDQSFLNDGSALMEDKNDSSVLSVLTNSPLPETIDIVNNELAPFNDDCIDMAVENDLLDIIL